MGIEYLSEKNIEELLALVEISHPDSAWKDYPFKRDTLQKNIVKMIDKSNYFTCLYRKNESLVGYWFASVGSFLFSDKLLGMENGIYIKREHRGGRAAFLMYKEFIAWCDRLDVEPFVEIYFGTEVENTKTYSFFRRVGMVECGKVFRGGRHGLRT